MILSTHQKINSFDGFQLSRTFEAKIETPHPEAVEAKKEHFLKIAISWKI